MDPGIGQSTDKQPALVAGIPPLTQTEEVKETEESPQVYETNKPADKSDYNENWSPSEKHKRAEEALSKILFGECRGQSIYCMTAVGHVAMNRARQNLDKRYGKGLWGVINKNKQFSCLNKNDPSFKVIEKAVAGKLKPGSKDAEKWKMAKDVAHILMHREEADPTLGATHYYAHKIVTPAWIKDRGMVRTVVLDGHTFYRKDA
jgi:spore germination cell wall hydrolase CwlJ-like protein